MSTVMMKPNVPQRYFTPSQSLAEQIETLDSLISTSASDTARVYTISPELAEHILKNRNGANRRPNALKVDEYVFAMKSKRWPVTGSTIVFSKTGYLLDGQHRLLASIRSKVPLTTFVAFNIEDGAFAMIDIGRKRSNVDAFTIQRVPHPHVAASAARWMLIHIHDPLNRGVTYTNDELYNYFKSSLDTPLFHGCVSSAIAVEKAGKDRFSGGTRRNYLPSGMLAGYLMVFSLVNRKHALQFADQLLNNQRHGRAYIQAIRDRMDSNGGRIHEVVRNALLVQAWNAFRNDVRPSKAIFTWNLSMDFPEVR